MTGVGWNSDFTSMTWNRGVVLSVPSTAVTKIGGSVCRSVGIEFVLKPNLNLLEQRFQPCISQ